MSEQYLPRSAFLRALAEDEMPLSGTPLGESNLRHLILLTEDEDPVNRDWAVLLLSQQSLDSDEIRKALIRRANDPDEFVRSEAILGLAQRDPQLALPFVQKALKGKAVGLPIFEAAALIGDASLAGDLRLFSESSGDSYLDDLIKTAIVACTPRAGSSQEEKAG